MANRADLIGRTYNLPQIQASPTVMGRPQGPNGAGAGAFDDGLNYETGLASVQGATEDYYKKIGMLKGFMQEAQANYGIDVRVPDYAKPISIRMNQMYQKALADIKAQGNLLKNSQSQFAATNYGQNVAFTGNQDPTTTPMASMRAGTDYVNRDVNPLVVEINNKLQQQFYGKSHEEAMAIYNKAVTDLKEYAKNNPSEAASIERSLNALTPPVQQEKLFAPGSDKTGYTKTDKLGIRAAEGELKRVSNLVTGNLDTYTYDPAAKPTEEGNKVYKNKKDYSGWNLMGQRIQETVSEIRPDGTTHTYFVLKDPSWNENKGTPQTQNFELTGRSPLEVAQMLSADNPGRGVHGKYLQTYVEDNDLLDMTGGVDPNQFVDPAQIEKMNKKRADEQAIAEKQQIAYRRKAVEERLKNMKTYAFGSDDTSDYVLPNGGKITVEVDREGGIGGTGIGTKVWKITGLKEAVNLTDAQRKKLSAARGGYKDVLEILMQLKAKPADAAYSEDGAYSENAEESSGTLPTENMAGRVNNAVPNSNTAPEKIKFKVDSDSGTTNIHPWASALGNKIVDAIGDTTLTFNSAYRTPERNKEVGGKDDSYHLDGAALDMKPADWKRIPEATKQALIKEFDLDVLDEGDHIHIEPNNRATLDKYKKAINKAVGTTSAPNKLITVPELAALPNETQAAYDLRLIKSRREKK